MREGGVLRAEEPDEGVERGGESQMLNKCRRTEENREQIMSYGMDRGKNKPVEQAGRKTRAKEWGAELGECLLK